MASRYSNKEKTCVSSNQSVDTEQHLHDECLNDSTRTNESYDESYSNQFCVTNDTYHQGIDKVLASLQKLVIDPDFIAHVQKDGFKMKNIVTDLMERRRDLTERDCAIIFAGETSAGKSTLINLIVGDDILPVDLEQSTTKVVCRIKYCDTLTVSKCNSVGKIVETETFESEEEMKESLEAIRENKDSNIEIVDIGFPVKILQGNRTCSIVDTPGIGDMRQDDYAQIMMKYLPNALAFVFVIDIANCGGFQYDRVIKILNHARTSMKTMLCFDPCDTIFILNKWDALIFRKSKPEEVVFAEKKELIRNLWEEVKDDYIVKLAAGRITGEDSDPFKKEYDAFYSLLNGVVARNNNKRTRVHSKFSNEFLNESKRVITWKLETVKSCAEERTSHLRKLEKDLDKLEDERKKALSDIGSIIGNFVDEATEECYDFLHQSSFQTDIIQTIKEKNVTRFGLEFVLESLIEKKIVVWERENIPRIFQNTTMEKITRTYTSIYTSLQMIKNDTPAFKMPSDIKDKIWSVLASFVHPKGNYILGSIVLLQCSVIPRVNDVISSFGLFAGIAASALIAVSALPGFDDVCVEAFRRKKTALTKDVIRQSFKEKYEDLIKDYAHAFLKGELEEEICNLKKNVKDMLGNLEEYTNEKDNLKRLNDKFTKVREMLRCLETSNDGML